jgi:PTS system ascorbate-specific IIA component
VLSNELIQRFHFFSKYDSHTLEEFESIINVSRKQLLMDIDRLNDVLDKYHLEEIRITQGVIHTPQVNLNDLFFKMKHDLEDYLFQEERGYMIVLYLFLNQEYVSNYDLQRLVRVSKNSVLSDIKQLRMKLFKQRVKLEYSRKRGYFLDGNALNLRNVLEHSIAELLTFEVGSSIIRYITNYAGIEISFEEFIKDINSISKKLKTNFITDKYKELGYLLAILNKIYLDEQLLYREELGITEINIDAEIFTQEVIKLYPNLKKEKFFILSRVLGCVSGNLSKEYDSKIYKVMDEIIDLVKANTGVEFDDTLQFRKNLYSHLLPAYYRLIFNNRLINPYKEQIMSDYSSLFYLIKKSLKPLRSITKKNISDDEIAYFTIHFGGYLRVEKVEETRQLKALAICPNGISSSLILTSELRQLFPTIHFSEIHQLDKMESVSPDEYDMIFSTIYLETSKPVYIVQPLMNNVEKVLLKKRLHKDFKINIDNTISIEEILKIIENHSIVEDKKGLKNDLYNYFMDDIKSEGMEGLGLTNLIGKEFIQQVIGVDDWKEAISVAAQPLLSKGYIESSYIEAMIDSVNKSGAYIVLAPAVAVPHASPEDGVNQLGMSLLQIKRPVNFNIGDEFDEDKLVQLVFVLAPIDSVSHLKALQQLASILDKEELIDKIIAAQSIQEIVDIMNRNVLEEE